MLVGLRSTNNTHTMCAQIVQSGFQQIIFGGAVEHCDLCSLRREQQCRGAPAQPCSKHGYVLVFVASVVHRSFSVASPSKAKMIERIHKRTMTVDSVQAVNSEDGG